MTDRKFRVLVVDDSSFMRSLLSRLIAKHPQLEVIDTAENGMIAIEKVSSLRPDVVTMDVEMPVMSGIEALKQIMQHTPTPVVMISSLTEEGAKATLDALAIGAVDFLPKALEDASRNVATQAEIIHDKLLAAAQARVAGHRPASAPAAMATAPAAKPLAPTAPALQPLKARSPRTAAKILLIGSSTGGPKALEQLIPQLPAELRVPVVIAQHMPAHFTTAMANRLNTISKVSVREAVQGDTLQPGTVYIAPGSVHMEIHSLNGQPTVSIHEDHGESHFRPSVDILALSLEKIYGGSVLAVMLTGMGSDGTKGFVQLKSRGAYVVAQDEASCVVYGMPRAVKEAGAVDEVVSLADMAGAITALLK